jgi:hypothetical protein
MGAVASGILEVRSEAERRPEEKLTLLPAPAPACDTVARGGGSRGGSSGWEVADRRAPRPASPGDGGSARLRAIAPRKAATPRRPAHPVRTSQ